MTLRSRSGERSRHSAGTALLREYLLRVDVNRPKHIDDYIDYFGNGGAPEGVPRRATPWRERADAGASGVSRGPSGWSPAPPPAPGGGGLGP